jgi:hypothetical protein
MVVLYRCKAQRKRVISLWIQGRSLNTMMKEQRRVDELKSCDYIWARHHFVLARRYRLLLVGLRATHLQVD